jgi:hypothetical protein
MFRVPSRFLRPNDHYLELYHGTVRTFVLFVGFGRSGHSILGQVVNAHPNGLVADEAPVFDEFHQPPSQREMLDYLIAKDRAFALRWYHKDLPMQTKTELPLRWYPRKKGRNYYFEGLQQGEVKLPSVIGNSKAGYTARRIAERPALVSEYEHALGVPVKFVSVVRNPFDMIASGMRRRKADFDTICSGFEQAASHLNAALDAIGERPVFHISHEEFLAEPQASIDRLFGFLELPVSPRFKNTVAGRLFKAPQKTRYRVAEISEHRGRIDSLIGSYDFFSGYSYDS